MKTIGIVANKGKPEARIVARDLLYLFEEKGANILIEEGLANDIGRADRSCPIDQFADRVDLVCVLGGDGTLLSIARRLAGYSIPIVGINLGTLGFLSEAEPTNLNVTVEKLLNGAFGIEERTMLEAKLLRNGEEIAAFTALNDVVIAKGSYCRIIQCTVYLDDCYVATFSGDGLIIASPTGSTAYSLSAGGPIVAPNAPVLLMTPVAPHSLTARPMIVSADQIIRVEVDAIHDEIGLSIDGQLGSRLKGGDEIMIYQSPFVTPLISWNPGKFFEAIRTKLNGEWE